MHAIFIKDDKIKLINVLNQYKKMGKKTETFKSDLKEIKDYLAKRRKLSDLAENLNVSVRTVHEALSVNSFDDLSGDRLTVYEAAIEMVDRIKNLPIKAKSVLKSE